MYELTQDQALEVSGGSGLGSDEFGTREHPPGAWLDINSGEVEELVPGYWTRKPGT